MNEDDVTAVVVSLARYLSAHPNACDSATGIASWWLPTGHEIAMDVLTRALAWFTRHGVLDEVTGADGRIRYRRIGDERALARCVDARGEPRSGAGR